LEALNDFVHATLSTEDGLLTAYHRCTKAFMSPCAFPQNQCSHHALQYFLYPHGIRLFDLTLEVLPRDQIWDVIIIIIVLLVITTLCLLHRLVALGKLSERGKGIGAELVEDTGDEFSEFLVFTVTVDGEGVGWNGGVDWR
jgi:hypothetical protein